MFGIIFRALLISILVVSFAFAQRPSTRDIPFDSLHQELIQAQTEKQKTDAYLSLGTALYAGNLRDSLFYYATKIDTTNDYGLAGSLFLKGLGLYRNFKLKESIEALESSLPILEQENPDAFLRAKMTLGIAYARTGQPEPAKKHYLEALDFLGDEPSPLKKSIYGNLGMAYRDLGNYSDAIQSFEKTIALSPEDKFSVANSYLNIATMFQRLEMLEKANETIFKIDTSGLTNSPIFIAMNNNLGENYFKLNQFDLAEKHLTISSAKTKQINQPHLNVKPNIILAQIAISYDRVEKARNYLNEAKLAIAKRPFATAELDLKLHQSKFFLHIDKPDSAILLANEAVALAASNKVSHKLDDVYKLLSQAYEQKGNIQKANAFLKRHNVFTDSLTNVGRLKALAEARARFEVAEKEKALATVEQDKFFFETLAFNITVVALLLVGGSVFLYIKFFDQRKATALKEKEIEVLNEELDKKSDGIKENISEHLLLKSKALIDLNQLMYIKSDGAYLEYYLEDRDRPEIDRNTLKNVISELPSDHFVQVHRSYIVNMQFVKSIFSTKLMLKTGEDINISRSFKSNLENILIKPV